MVKRDAEDILRDIKADIEGISPKDVKFKDLRKKIKKKKNIKSESKPDTIYNEEDFTIVGSKSKTCNYREITKKRQIKEKNCLEEWGAFDFFYFAHKLYLKKYKINWDLNVGGNSIEINRIKDKFLDLFGFCCNLMMRDYIIFFFNNYIDYYIREEGDFYFKQMRKTSVMESFKDGYDFQKSFSKYMTKEKKGNKEKKLTKEEVKKSFSMGDTTLVGNYGVVISLNWLLKIKRMKKKEAIKLIIDACVDMHRKDMIGVVKKATEVYSPYPSNLAFTSPQLIFNKIDKNIKLKVDFIENSDKMQFLQK